MSRHLHIYLYNNWIRGWKSTNRKVSIYSLFSTSIHRTFVYVLCGGCFAFGAPHDMCSSMWHVLRYVFHCIDLDICQVREWCTIERNIKSMPETTTSPIHIGKISLNYFRIAVACKADGRVRTKTKAKAKQNKIVNEMQALCAKQRQQPTAVGWLW